MNLRQKFKSAIKRGTGETHLLMKDNPNVDFSNDIIKASLTNLSYDNQSEGSRASYIFELYELSGQKDKIRDAILKGLSTEQKDTWALEQLFDLAALFAKLGDIEARKAIYKRFYKNIIPGSEWVGQESIIGLDGLEGLMRVAEIKGRIIQKDPQEWEDSWFVEYFQEENPSIRVYSELKKASKANTYIKTYLDTIKKHKTEAHNVIRPKYNYKTVSERIENDVRVPLPPAGEKDLSKADIKKLADDFLRAKERNKLEKYMQVFDRVKYPYDYLTILRLAKSRNKKSDRLIEYATGALKYFSGADIRQFALEKLNKVRIPSLYLDLLVSNYKKGDSKLLTDIINRCRNQHEIHSIVYGLINIYETNSTKECKEPLESVYDKLTCGIHRTHIFKILISNKVLSDRLKKEIKFDSSDETRALYTGLQNSRTPRQF
jgi:hypothetical protein